MTATWSDVGDGHAGALPIWEVLADVARGFAVSLVATVALVAVVERAAVLLIH